MTVGYGDISPTRGSFGQVLVLAEAACLLVFLLVKLPVAVSLIHTKTSAEFPPPYPPKKRAIS
jgi:hypothetical protein